MKARELRSKFFLTLAAAIWGFAFVAQRASVKYIGPFTFNGIRFALGCLSLIPLIIFMKDRKIKDLQIDHSLGGSIKGGIAAGSIIFLGASLQQIGIVYTSAGKAAFITGLYIVLVPLFGIFLKKYINMMTWAGVILSIVGLYLLCINEDFTISKGDLFEIVGAFFWAMHILLIDKLTKKIDALNLSFIQFATCSVLSITAGILFENINISAFSQAIVPIIYGGFFSVGIAYTLQVIGQKYTEPSHAAIILSMETVFASIGGFLLLNENLGIRGYIGCALMFVGMLLAQLKNNEELNKETVTVN